MESVDDGDVPVAPAAATLASELIAHAAAIGAGEPRASSTALLPHDLRAALRASEVRARRLADGWGQGAALLTHGLSAKSSRLAAVSGFGGPAGQQRVTFWRGVMTANYD